MTGETEKEVQKVLVAVRTFVAELTGLAKDVREMIVEERASRKR